MRNFDMTPTVVGEKCSRRGNLCDVQLVAEVAVADTPRARVAGPLRRVRAVIKTEYAGNAQFRCGAKLRIVAWDFRRQGLDELFEALSTLGEELCHCGMLRIEDAKSPC
jgi:hypothetical protein